MKAPFVDSLTMTPIRKEKGHVVHAGGDVWSSTLSSETSQKTQIELDSKYFRPTASKETELTSIFGGFGLATQSGGSSDELSHSQPKPDFDIVNSRRTSQQEELGFDDSDFLSGDDALKMLDEHEAEFEEENRLRLDSHFEANENANQQEFSIRSNDGNISKFFAAGTGGLGLGEAESPTKSAFKKPNVPIEYGGASETVVIDKRRDTVSTVKSLNFSTLDSTAAFDKYHHGLKAMESDSSDESYQKIQKQHEKLRADETLGSIQGSHDRNDRYSIGSLCSENLGKLPRSQSSPSKSSDSTNLHLDSIDSMENTNIDELCKTKCGSFVTLCSKEGNETHAESTVFPEKTASSSSSKGSLLTKQRRSSVNAQNARTTRFASLPAIPNYDSVGSFPSQPPPMGPHQSNPLFKETSRPYSPAPLVEVSNEVDFANFVFTGDSKTEVIHVRPQTNWVSCRICIRSILLDSKPISFEESPFVLRQVEFNLTHGQPIFVPISFRPKMPGRYLSVLELRSTPAGQYQNAHENHPSRINHQEQICAVNVMGLAVKPCIKIDNGSGMYRWEENGKNRIDLENTSDFNIPVIVEIDYGYELILDGSPVSKIVLPARTSVPLQLASNAAVPRVDSSKLKVYLDGREKTAIEFCTITRPPPVVQLSGPEITPRFNVHSFSSSNEQITIHNCGDCSANINAIIDGPVAQNIQVSPGTASIPADGELVFSLKIVGERRLARSMHRLILEISGTDEEFVCPFEVTVLDQFDQSKSSRPKQERQKTAANTSRHQKTSSSVSSGAPTSLSSNRSILLWPKLAAGQPESKSVTLRGRGDYALNLSGRAYKVFMNDKQVQSGEVLKFSSKKDVLLQVRCEATSDDDLVNSKLNLVSVDDSSLKSCIPLISQVGNPVVTINGEANLSKLTIPVTFGKGSSMLLKNTGTAEAFVHFLQTKNSEKGLVDPQVVNLRKGEEKTIVFTSSKTSGNDEIMMYSGSARLREIMGTILNTEKGAAAWKKTLGKLNSAKITRLNFGFDPKFGAFDDLGILPDNYISVFNTFLRHLTVDTINIEFQPVPKKTHTRTSSLDSVPTKHNGQNESPSLVVTPSLLDLNRENELTVMATGISQPVIMSCKYDESMMRVAPTRLELKPGKKEKLIVIPLNANNHWVQSLLLQTDKVSQSVGVKHLGAPRNELVFSQNLVDFGSVDGKLPVSKKVSLTNKDEDTCSWLLIQQAGARPEGRFSLTPRDGELKPGQSVELTIRFAPPRVPDTYEQDWLIEYHKKGEVGLARTMRRISLKTKAATKLLKSFELKPATAIFSNISPDTGTRRMVIQLQNRTHSPMNITASVAEKPFSDKQRSFTLKDGDQSLPSKSSSNLKRKFVTFGKENTPNSVSPPKLMK